MKSLLTGFLLLVVGLLIAPVSFASDGPPTTKVCEIVADSDYDYSIVIFSLENEANVFCESTLNYSKSEGVYLTDVGKSPKLDLRINDYALPSYFAFESPNKHKFPYYNEWLEYKDELTFKPYTESVILRERNFNRLFC